MRVAAGGDSGLPAQAAGRPRRRRAVARAGPLQGPAGASTTTTATPATSWTSDDDGKLLGGPSFLPLPNTRADYEKALQAAGLDSWKAGYLPYSIIDQHQQLTKDFGYWRAVKAAAAREKNRETRLAGARRRPAARAVSCRPSATSSHFVGDGSQPLHVSVHYNGWGGEYPNPNGYTTARVHGPFESEFVFNDREAGRRGRQGRAVPRLRLRRSRRGGRLPVGHRDQGRAVLRDGKGRRAEARRSARRRLRHRPTGRRGLGAARHDRLGLAGQRHRDGRLAGR